MKRILFTLFMLMSTVWAMAQTANVVFEEKFAGNLGDFTVEGFNGEYNDIWTGDYDCAKADAYRRIGSSEELTNYLVSPEIQLGDKDYEAKFEHCCDYFTDHKTQAVFVVREVGGSWIQIDITKYWSGMFTVADKMPVPAEMKGKTVQFGFRYKSSGSYVSGIWKIKNFVVKEKSELPDEKAEPMIAFGVYELKYDLGSRDPFASPKLFNPFGLPVKYTSENEAVATVDADGVVTVLAEGVTTITATTEETQVYKAGKDSYVLNVTDEHKNDPILKDPELSFSETEVEHELCYSETFEAPVFHNPHGVDVKFYSDVPDVASVDELTGEVTIHAVGTTVISALSWDDKEYRGGFAKYTLRIIDNTVLLEGTDFGEDRLCGFTEEGEAAGQYIWMPTVYGGWLLANGYKKTDHETVTYMVSPAVTLDRNGNTLSFVHTAYQFYNFDDRHRCTTVHIREVGGEWEQLDIPYPLQEYEQVAVEGLEIPAAYNGKHIQVGFRYVCDGTIEGSGTWAFKDVFVRRAHLKPAADLVFAAETAGYDLGGDAAFTAPALLYADNLDVRYASSDESVATVDALTGAVTPLAAGTTVISATSAENEWYTATTTTYRLTVTDTPTGITAVIEGTDTPQEVYDLQGRRVPQPARGIYIVDGQKRIVK